MARVLPELEEMIRRHPDQWSSFFNLWSKTQRPVWAQYTEKLRRKR